MRVRLHGKQSGGSREEVQERCESSHLPREAGLDDSEILDVDQVVSYFAWPTGRCSGPGVAIGGEIPGLSRDSDYPDDRNHD